MENDMNKNANESFLVAVILSVSGGLMDAYSYICRGQVFANAQTGNLLLFGVNLTTGNLHTAFRYIIPVIAFAAGIASSEFFQHALKNKQAVHWSMVTLVAETVILSIVALLPQSMNLAANSMTSFACGIQVESFRRLNGSGIATTMCIGNLRSAVQSVCNYGYTKNKIFIKDSVLYFCLIVTFVLGAVAGNACIAVFREKAILASCILLILALIIIFLNMETKSNRKKP